MVSKIRSLDIELRKTEYTEAEKLAEMQKAAFMPLYEIYQDEGNPFLRGAEDITIRLEHPEDFIYRSIYFDNKLVGGMCYRILGKGEYYLQRIFIMPEFHGMGLASGAIIKFENTLTDAVQFTLEFPIDRLMNKRCYEKAGYVDTGKREQISERLVLAHYIRKCV
jgi:GNAT superfamily N-acetyltransferase